MDAQSFENIIQRPSSLEMEYVTFGAFQLVHENRIKEFKEMMKRDLFNPNVKDGNGDPLLFRTLNNGKLEFAKALLAHPKIDVNAKELDDRNEMWCYVRTALMRLTGFTQKSDDKMAILKMLLDRPEIDVNARDRNKDTALTWNMYCGTPEALKLLMRRKDLDVNAENIFGKDALRFLIQKRPKGGKADTYPKNEHSIPHLELLLTHPGVNMGPKSILKFWETPFSSAREHTPSQFVEILRRYQEDPKLTSVAMKIKHDMLTPAELFCIIYFKAERYNSAFTPGLVMMKKIMDVLPIELKMRVCNLAFGVNKEFISQKEIDDVMAYL